MVESSKSNVNVFIRLRPVPRKSRKVAIDNEDGTITFHIPREESAGLINNQREKYNFVFNGVLTEDSKQEEVFERVCHPAINEFMDGFNATVFAYGQTGSGKTFTITGGPERYADRGMIPRAISLIFKRMAADTHQQYSLHISYMEIYNSTAYDLLDPSRDIKELSDLPPVTILEDDEGRFHMRQLSLNPASSEEDALNLLFLGDTNRMIAETPMNMASSRSHCVFTLHLEARRPGEATVRRSKLHLVDLAGSERVSKSGIGGSTLSEAKYINASLLFLEQVIIALQERAMGIARPHVPYRNSLMTMVLRDSLGGNCKTTMVANLNVADAYVDESISTCRFAQRVAMIANSASINEETDPQLIIAALRQQVRDLKDEVRLLQGGEEARGPLTEDELQRLRQTVNMYVADKSPDAVLRPGASMMFINAAFSALKDLARGISNRGKAAITPFAASSSPTPSASGSASGPDRTALAVPTHDEAADGAAERPGDAANKGVLALREENGRLRLQVQQRDNEINILVSMLKKREANLAAAAAAAAPSPAGAAAGPPPAEALALEAAGSAQRPAGSAEGLSGSADAASGAVAGPDQESGNAGADGVSKGKSADSGLLDMSALSDRNRAFELFRKSYRRNAAIESSKAELKEKYTQAKALGSQANALRTAMASLKQQLEQRRMQRAAADIAAGGSGALPDDAGEADADVRAELAERRAEYKAAFDGLRDRKLDIERLQGLLERSRQQMATDFQAWYVMMSERAPAAQEGELARSDALAGENMHQTSSPYGAMGVEHRSGGTTTQDAHLPAAAVPIHPFTTPAESAAATVTGVGQATQALLGISPGTNGTGKGKYPEEVVQAAAPFLTGDPTADEDILGFYLVRHKMIQSGT
eukprot:jgi/Ulvmu1/10945/UM007_0124.1